MIRLLVSSDVGFACEKFNAFPSLRIRHKRGPLELGDWDSTVLALGLQFLAHGLAAFITQTQPSGNIEAFTSCYYLQSTGQYFRV
jgi:hypothetical protein